MTDTSESDRPKRPTPPSSPIRTVMKSWQHGCTVRLRPIECPARWLANTWPLPKRLGRCFRDCAELSAADDLAREIREALEQSDALIVLCSPRSAGSQYVEEEIRYFKSLGRGARILAAIADGEPHAVGKSINGRALTEADECFPRSLAPRRRRCRLVFLVSFAQLGGVFVRLLARTAIGSRCGSPANMGAGEFISSRCGPNWQGRKRPGAPRAILADRSGRRSCATGRMRKPVRACPNRKPECATEPRSASRLLPEQGRHAHDQGAHRRASIWIARRQSEHRQAANRAET